MAHWAPLAANDVWAELKHPRGITLMYSLATFTAFDFTSRFHMQIDRKLVGDPCALGFPSHSTQSRMNRVPSISLWQGTTWAHGLC
jgi:hypothetical protein